jgi:hypothetical protein
MCMFRSTAQDEELEKADVKNAAGQLRLSRLVQEAAHDNRDAFALLAAHALPAALLAFTLACYITKRCGAPEFNVIPSFIISQPRAWWLPAAKQPHCCACQALQLGLGRRPRQHRCRLVRLHPRQSMADALPRTHGGGNSTVECTQAGRQQRSRAWPRVLLVAAAPKPTRPGGQCSNMGWPT